MSSLLSRVQAFIETNELLAPGERVLVGCSGGVDSVALVHVLDRLGYELSVAHVNYGLREAADRDEAFVRALCEACELPVAVAHCDVAARAEAEGRSLQDVARDVRYAFFGRSAEAEGIPVVAVGHHADDQAETVLLNLFRGAGPEGLAGMRPARPLFEGSSVTLVRPLLPVRRADVEAYVDEEGLSWREDVTNAGIKYRRGALRNEILPEVERHFGKGVVGNVARAARLMRAYVDDTLSRRLDRLFDEACTGEGRLALRPLRQQPPVWRRRVFLAALARWIPEAPRSAAVAEEIDSLMTAQPGRRVEVGGGAVWRERTHLVFLTRAEKVPEGAGSWRVAPGEPAELPYGTLRVDLLDERPEQLDSGSPNTAFLDADALSFPLAARRWRPGDRFQPLGMEGTKKVSDLLTDEKAPSHRRADVVVVLSVDEIVWVAGYRIADPVRVRPDTTRVARITYIPH